MKTVAIGFSFLMLLGIPNTVWAQVQPFGKQQPVLVEPTKPVLQSPTLRQPLTPFLLPTVINEVLGSRPVWGDGSPMLLNGELAYLKGRGFGDSQGDRTLVIERPDGDSVLRISRWSDTEIVFFAPTAEQAGVTFRPGQTGRRFPLTFAIAQPSQGYLAKRNAEVFIRWNNWDFDGDGSETAVRGRGDDCDDYDSRRYPGNIERADDQGVDEDCNPDTIGTLDRDGDGFTDQRIFNRIEGRITKQGNDCDDTRAYIHPGAAELPNGMDDNCDGQVDNLEGNWTH